MLVTQHFDCPELVALWEEKDGAYKENILFKNKCLNTKERL